jgi:hypothetical protein
MPSSYRILWSVDRDDVFGRHCTPLICASCIQRHLFGGRDFFECYYHLTQKVATGRTIIFWRALKHGRGKSVEQDQAYRGSDV